MLLQVSKLNGAYILQRPRTDKVWLSDTVIYGIAGARLVALPLLVPSGSQYIRRTRPARITQLLHSEPVRMRPEVETAARVLVWPLGYKYDSHAGVGNWR